MGHPHYPNALVTGADLDMNLGDPGLKVIEVDFDESAYAQGHLPNAFRWLWSSQLRNSATEEILTREEFEALMSASGIRADDTVVVYGDENNWFACWAYWLCKLYGHDRVFVLDGGTRKWLTDGRRMELGAEPFPTPSDYRADEANPAYKASVENIFEAFFNPATHRLLDVRSSSEFEGRLLGPGVGKEATCALGGHIPTAINVPWNLNCDEDGCFKEPGELRDLYRSFNVIPENHVITYCAIGERASLSWFVLHELLGYPMVMNYDRSMAQWSRMANAPIVQGEAA